MSGYLSEQMVELTRYLMRGVRTLMMMFSVEVCEREKINYNLKFEILRTPLRRRGRLRRRERLPIPLKLTLINWLQMMIVMMMMIVTE